jgi:hypothetical protein
MKFLGAIALTGVFLLPSTALAACSADGATVVYVNGIFTTEKQARADAKNLAMSYLDFTGDNTVKFINAYNPSHLAGAGDLMQAAAQLRGKSISGFDLRTILLQMHPQVTTRKLLLVGHSQGSFYANDVYDYLLSHGEPKASVGVYQVGSPASHVAGGGKYLNSSGDAMLGTLRGMGFTFLPDNIDLASSGDDARKVFFGHSFSGAYLAEAPGRVVGDVQKALGKLKAESPSDAGDCFTAPDAGLGYTAAKAGFAVADTAALAAKAGAQASGRAAVAVGNALAAAAQAAYGAASKVAADIGVTVGGVVGLSHAAEPENAQTNFDILSKLYGSSLSKDDYRELMGGAVAMAPVFASAPSQQDAARSAGQQAAPVPVSDSREDKDDAAFLLPLLAGSGGSRHHRASSNEPEPEVPAADSAPSADAASSTQEAIVAPPVQEATTTPAETATTTPETPAPSYALVFEDTFDTFNSKGWQTPSDIYSGTLIPFEQEPADSGLCHTGACITGKGGEGGLGTAPRTPFAAKLVGESASGYLTVWVRRRDGIRTVTTRAFACVAGTECRNMYSSNLSAPSDDQWHQHLFAWRTTPEGLWLCGQMDALDVQSCAWGDTHESNPPAAFDGVALWGFAPRTDYGDRILLDDIEVYVMR